MDFTIVYIPVRPVLKAMELLILHFNRHIVWIIFKIYKSILVKGGGVKDRWERGLTILISERKL